ALCVLSLGTVIRLLGTKIKCSKWLAQAVHCYQQISRVWRDKDGANDHSTVGADRRCWLGQRGGGGLRAAGGRYADRSEQCHRWRRTAGHALRDARCRRLLEV